MLSATENQQAALAAIGQSVQGNRTEKKEGAANKAAGLFSMFGGSDETQAIDESLM